MALIIVAAAMLFLAFLGFSKFSCFLLLMLYLKVMHKILIIILCYCSSTILQYFPSLGCSVLYTCKLYSSRYFVFGTLGKDWGLGLRSSVECWSEELEAKSQRKLRSWAKLWFGDSNPVKTDRPNTGRRGKSQGFPCCPVISCESDLFLRFSGERRKTRDGSRRHSHVT